MALEDKAQDAKGRVEEAAGAVTGDKEMKAKGWKDQAEAKVKDFAGDVKEEFDKGKESLKDKAEELKKKHTK